MRRSKDSREGRRDFRRASSGRGKGRLCIWRHGGWLETVNRGMRGSTKNFVWAGIGRSEGRM
jgi:hypothetical protein